VGVFFVEIMYMARVTKITSNNPAKAKPEALNKKVKKHRAKSSSKHQLSGPKLHPVLSAVLFFGLRDSVFFQIFTAAQIRQLPLGDHIFLHPPGTPFPSIFFTGWKFGEFPPWISMVKIWEPSSN